MKRANTNNSDGTNNAKSDRSKRPKTQSACVSCKKHKTRCEPSSEQGDSRCHRCRVLGLSCSFEASDVMLSSSMMPAGPSAVRAELASTRAGAREQDSNGPSLPELQAFNASAVTPDDIMDPARPVDDKYNTSTWVCAEPMRAMVGECNIYLSRLKLTMEVKNLCAGGGRMPLLTQSSTL
jgi:hypothetical protein